MGGILGQPHPAVSSIIVGSLLGASKVSRVLGGMADSNILGRPWLCLRVETINVGGGGTVSSDIYIHMLAASLMPHQAPSEILRGTWRANQRDMLTNKPCRTVRPPANTLQFT